MKCYDLRMSLRDSFRCRGMKSYESDASLLVGYRRLDSAGDDQEPMTLCSSEDDYSDSDSSELGTARLQGYLAPVTKSSRLSD